jgi:hypothetical protein
MKKVVIKILEKNINLVYNGKIDRQCLKTLTIQQFKMIEMLLS